MSESYGRQVNLANHNSNGLLKMICPICNARMVRVELSKMNTCDYCDSDIGALPPKGDSVYCEIGVFTSRHH